MLATTLPRAAPFFASVAVAGWHLFAPPLREIETEIAATRARLTALPEPPALQTLERAGFHSGIARARDSVRWVQVDLGLERALDSVVVVPAFSAGVPGYGFPRRYRIDASNDAAFGESTTLLDRTGADVAESSLPIHAPAGGVTARYVRFTATQLVEQPRLPGGYICCLGEMLVFSGGRNVALRRTVTAPSKVETLPTWSAQYLVDGWSALGLPIQPGPLLGNGWHSAIATAPDAAKRVQVDLGASRELQEIRLIPARPPDFPDRLGFGFPPRFRVEVAEDATFAAPRVVFDATDADFPNPGDNPVAIPLEAVKARCIRVTATRLWERTQDFVFALAELQAFSGGENVAAGAAVSDLDQVIAHRWSRAALVDGRTSTGVLLDEATWLRQLADRTTHEQTLADLEARRLAAIAIAQRRAAWSGVAVLAALGLVAIASVRRSRLRRQQEVEALRERISRDLHDEIGSHLGSIRLMSELALRESAPTDARETVAEIHRLAGEAAESMRGIVWLVRAGEAPPLSSLVEALRQSAAVLLKGLDWELTVTGGDDATRAPLDFHRHVFLLFREAAHNLARHAGATRARIEVEWTTAQFQLRITDDGRGFDTAAPSHGSGLANLRHRASALHGTLDIQSAPGEGTRVNFAAPLP
jgi:signal transduction histidine kinase